MLTNNTQYCTFVALKDVKDQITVLSNANILDIIVDIISLLKYQCVTKGIAKVKK